MKFSTSTARDRNVATNKYLRQPHQWFAWHPVKDRHNTWYFLCYVEREYVDNYLYSYWQYRDITP